MITSFSQSIDGIVSSTGTTLSSQGVTLSFSVGAPVVLTDNGTSILFDNINVDALSAHSYDQSNQITFYPNPCTNTLYATDPSDIMSIYNINGTLVKQVTKSININVEDLSPGTYLLVSTTNNKVSTFKFIKR